jgi:hypothetical protein
MRIELNGNGNAEQVFSALGTVANRGASVYVEWLRPLKTLKTTTQSVSKRVRVGVRYGVDYANIATVRNAIEAGERGEVESLPWGEWRKGREGLIIDHKGQEYCRLAAGTLRNMVRSTVYFVDGNEVDESFVRPLCLASEFRERDEAPTVFNVKPQTVLSVGRE